MQATVPVLYEEQTSAVKRRPVLDRLMDDARRGKVRAVVVWALIAPEEDVRVQGIAEIETTLLELEAKGLVRRTGMRKGKIVWTAVKPS